MKRQSRSVRAALTSAWCARAPPAPLARPPARPQAPRGPRHVIAPSQGGSGGRASSGGGGGRGSGRQLRRQRGAGGVEVWRRRERRTGTDVYISRLRGRNKSWASGQDTSLGIVAADTTSQSHTMSVWFKEIFHI